MAPFYFLFFARRKKIALGPNPCVGIRTERACVWRAARPPLGHGHVGGAHLAAVGGGVVGPRQRVEKLVGQHRDRNLDQLDVRHAPVTHLLLERDDRADRAVLARTDEDRALGVEFAHQLGLDRAVRSHHERDTPALAVVGRGEQGHLLAVLAVNFEADLPRAEDALAALQHLAEQVLEVAFNLDTLPLVAVETLDHHRTADAVQTEDELLPCHHDREEVAGVLVALERRAFVRRIVV